MNRLTRVFFAALTGFILFSPPASSEDLNVILVTLDTVRADHTTPFGYFRDTTPRFADLARRGVLFKKAFSQSNWTLPAVASLFTGKRPQSHGLVSILNRLDDSEVPLAETFRSHGYRTAAFTGGFISDPAYGLNRGFETARAFLGPFHNMGSLRDSLGESLKWLEAHSDEKFLLWIHGADAHYPYLCPDDYRYRFADPKYRGLAFDLTLDNKFVQAFDTDEVSLDTLQISSPEDWDKAQRVKKDKKALDYLRAQYDGCLSYQDSILSQLDQVLAEKDLWKKTVVVILSDHGEALGDHGGYGHASRPLHGEIVHIPLLFLIPGLSDARRGAVVGDPVEIIDVLPTLAEFMGWPAPHEAEGQSLKPEILGGSFGARRGLLSAAAKSTRGERRLDIEAFQFGRWKVSRDGEEWGLYDLSQDPGETRNLILRRPDIFLELGSRWLQLDAKK